ncbi:MAG: hypothetical protein JNL64_06905 [Blastocatellia bacterium]|nr:hypothetical protein [Blastocatellia bacterium]
MRPNWKELPVGDVVGQWAAHYVTLNRKGQIVMSRKTYRRAGEPEAFNILFDDVNNRIGLKPTRLSMKNAYRVAPCGRHGGKMVRAYRLLTEYNIDLPATVQFQNIEFDEGDVMILDLRTAKVSARAKTTARRQGGGAANLCQS